MTIVRAEQTQSGLRQESNSALLWMGTAAILFAQLFRPVSAMEGRELTIYTGFRDGGSFEDLRTQRSVSLDSSAAFAASLDFPLDEASKYQVFFSFQDTNLGLESVVTGTLIDPDFPLQVMYLHVGGTTFMSDAVGKGGYFVGGLGATLFYPTSPGYDSELRLSANVGLGYQQPIGKRMSLRFEARGYFTLLNSSSAMFCSGGCTVAVSGDGTVQGELSIGLSFGL